MVASVCQRQTIPVHHSTAVAGKLIKTDDSQQLSRDVFSTEDQKGSQLECAKKEDSLFDSPGSNLQKELAKNGTIFCKDGSQRNLL